MKKVSLADKFERVHDHWHPRIVAELNDTQVKVVKIQGEFHWHHHEHEDELFLVVKGRLCIELRTGVVWLAPGELLVVPRGVEHRPVAPEEVYLVLIEPRGTLNTGNVANARTVNEPEWL